MAGSNDYNNFSRKEVESFVQRFEMSIRAAQNVYLEQPVFLQIIEYYEDKLETDKALEAAELAQSHYPFSAIFKIKTARCLHEIGETEEAFDLLSDAYILDGTEVEYYLLKSEILSSEGKYKLAMEVIEQGLSFADRIERFDLLLSLSDIQESNLNYQGVFDALSKAAFIYPNDFEVADRLAFCVDELQCFAEAINLYNQLLDKEPYLAYIWYNLGKTYSELKLYEKAIEAFDFTLVIKDEHYDAQFEKAEAYYDLKIYDKALDNYLEAMTLKEADEDLYYCLGFTYYHLKNHSLAISHFKNAISCNPSHTEAYFQLGKIKEEHGFLDTALHYYEKALSIDENNTEYLKGIADFYYKAEKFDMATKYYINALTIDPSVEQSWLRLSSCYAYLDLFSEALQVIEFGINTNEKSSILIATAGIYCWQIGKQQTSIKYFTRALDIDKGIVNLIFNELPFLKENPQIQHLLSLT